MTGLALIQAKESGRGLGPWEGWTELQQPWLVDLETCWRRERRKLSDLLLVQQHLAAMRETGASFCHR